MVKPFSNLNSATITDDHCCCCLLLFGRIPEAAVVIVLYVLGERWRIGLELKSALDQLGSPKTAFKSRK
jgi:hypothetical protein